MTDIKERLRDRVNCFNIGTCTVYYDTDAELDNDAVDYIEKLEAEAERLTHHLNTALGTIDVWRSTIDTLKAENEKLEANQFSEIYRKTVTESILADMLEWMLTNEQYKLEFRQELNLVFRDYANDKKILI